ncbi:uncharacterized protein LOC119735640 [Patiria miniata]|uniref:HAT C-terminal dimerisation domain-containing protein n=1 Tax=Patiria miniata TaxID=46514 RepID=A0A914AMV3_PATMI|nr:uncharacterized protein LOC119735640 [Patiria miniata]
MTTKATRKGQFYGKKYGQEFDFITSSKKDKQHAFCKVCRRDVSIAHGGRNDIVKHTKSKLHVDSMSMRTEAHSTMKLTSWASTSQDLNVTRAECLFTAFYLEHNIPLSAASHVGPLLRKAFPNSEEVKKFSSARTKTTCLVHEMAKDGQSRMISSMKASPFAISTDGSNTSSSKLYPIVVNYYDSEVKQVVCSLLSMTELEDQSTGENIAKLLITELKKHDVPWQNCTALGSDNASVMVGRLKGVGTYLKECQPEIIVLGCPNHRIDLAAKAASSAIPFSIDSLLIDVFYYLEASVNRKLELRKFQKLCGNEVQAVLKHVCTRWLFLGQCLPRFLNQWNALQIFFEEEQKPKGKGAKKQSPADQISPNIQAFRIPKMLPGSSNMTSKSADGVSSILASKSSSSSTPPSTSKGSSPQRHAASQGEKRQVDGTVQTCKRQRTESVKTTKKPNVHPPVAAASKVGKPSGSSKKKPSTPKPSVASSHGRNTSKTEEGNEETRQQRIATALQSKYKLAVAHFLSQSISAFDRKSVILQTRSPYVHKLKRELEGLLLDLYSKFVEPEAIKAVTDLTYVNYKNPKNQKEDKELVIGSETRDIMDKELDDTDCKKFFAMVRLYYTKACDYIVTKFPLKSVVLAHAEVADCSLRVNAKFSSVKYFTDKFPCMLFVKEDETKYEATDILQSQFLAYQLADIPEAVQNETDCDKQWAVLAAEKDPSGQLCYDRLAKVMLGILTIPHSNAECERVFSQVRKNKTDFRGSMSTDVLSSVLITKAQQRGPCYSRDFDDKFLRRAKSATYRTLNESDARVL